MPHRLKPLLDAINGLPTERKATATVAVYAVIPMSIVGILVGAWRTPNPSPDWVLFAYGGGGAVVSAAVVIGAVYLSRWLFGFGAVVRVAEGLIGLMAGAALGVALAGLFDLGWAPLLLAPAFAILNLVFRPLVRLLPPGPVPDEPPTPGERVRRWWRKGT
jgi:hypothetical protein